MGLWIARDYIFNSLYLYKNRPELDGDRWISNDGMYRLDNDLFPEVTFENSPQEVELKLINEIVGVAESPLKTFPRTNIFEVGASYRH